MKPRLCDTLPPCCACCPQTTNKIFNDELFERLDARSVLSWQRVRTANWLARDGQASRSSRSLARPGHQPAVGQNGCDV